MVKVEYDYSELKQKIAEKYGNRGLHRLAKDSGVSVALLSMKLRNDVGFSREDIIKVSKCLKIKEKDYGRYFFREKVQSDVEN